MHKTYLFYVQEQARAYWKISPLIIIITLASCLFGYAGPSVMIYRMALVVLLGIFGGAAVKRVSGGKLLFE